jgi:Ca-activated chloride channel family protein
MVIKFGSPHFFWLLLALPLLIGFFIWAWQQKQSALRRFAAVEILSRLTPESGLNRWVIKSTFILAFFIFMVGALVRPQFGLKMQEIERKGIDVMVALDVSESMLAEDIAPNRLDRAKHEIAKFIDLIKGDRIGIVVFAGQSYIQCPLTLDYGAAKMFLDVVTTDWIQLQGTALGEAIKQSVAAFRSQDKKHRVLILLSDGEDHEGDPVAAAKQAADEGVKIYTVGIGSESGVPIPMQRSGGNVVYKKDNGGNLVMTKLNPQILEELAHYGGGKYFNAGTSLDLSQIYNEIAAMEKKDLGMSKLALYEERYQILLLIALLLLAGEFLIPERVKHKEEWRGRFE